MSDSKWDKVVVGAPITSFGSGGFYCDNFLVVAKGYNWAVLRKSGTEDICGYVLEPSDDYEIGFHDYDEDSGSLVLVEQ